MCNQGINAMFQPDWPIPRCMDITTWNRPIWFERISESRRPRFEPDLMLSDYHYDYVLEKMLLYI